jgi:hypothetical protein
VSLLLTEWFLANKEREILPPRALQLEPECPALFVELLQLCGIYFGLACSNLSQKVSQSCFSSAAFTFGLARSNLSLNVQHVFAELLQLRGILLRPSSLQLEPECPAGFAELLQLCGILLWPSSLQLEPECSARFAELLQLRPSSLQLEPESFAELLQLRGIHLRLSSLQLEPECQHVSRSCFSCAAFTFGLARSKLNLNFQHVSQSCFSCAAFSLA